MNKKEIRKNLFGNAFGDFVRRARQEKGLTLREFCKEVGISNSFVSCMERNEVLPPTEERIRKMAQVLSVDPDYLIVLAAKTPLEVQQMIFKRPNLIFFIRKANERSDDELLSMGLM